MNERELLVECLDKLKIEMSPLQIDLILQFMEYLLEKNKYLNLTSITDRRDFIYKHIVDSLIMINKDYVYDGIKIIDIGTGGGFPGIPLKILYPFIDITLVDSVEKKLKFIDEACSKFDIKVNLIHERAENLGRDIENREKYDIVVSRAVANMQTLTELCLPLAKVGGLMIASKGPKCMEEIKLAGPAITLLGGDKPNIENICIPTALLERNIVTIRKSSKTPKTYPRKPGMPNKNPL
ncbi:16S rRNA (guanine(527)-N(7))-methyltransferase RsmG [Alkalibaculum sp. M08DMB]|uniref:Ribosomal RNA small subunit methyltransferase G n=2 Tax=Alkalibaculum sporogenes TaxID=2655001 RepID=A0A6A7K734_9FIRM|nr:16S rRNA (guanine(527)-N(7))-methyltransferase RsmG [Alkalibaculum sporogenes]